MIISKAHGTVYATLFACFSAGWLSSTIFNLFLNGGTVAEFFVLFFVLTVLLILIIFNILDIKNMAIKRGF